MKKSDVFPSKYFRPADVPEPITLTISDVTLEDMKGHNGQPQQKPVLRFLKTPKLMVVNPTNFDSIADVTGKDDTDGWPGCTIQIYSTEVQVGGEMKLALRVRSPDQAELPTRRPVKQAEPADADLDDEIPF